MPPGYGWAATSGESNVRALAGFRLPTFLCNMRYVLHLSLTAMIGWWAAILASPLPTFPTSKSYAAFVRICPNENSWALAFAVVTLIAIVGCWAAWPSRPPSRSALMIKISSALLLGLTHGTIALLTFRSNPGSTGTGIYALIMLMAYLLAASEAQRIE